MQCLLFRPFAYRTSASTVYKPFQFDSVKDDNEVSVNDEHLQPQDIYNNTITTICPR